MNFEHIALDVADPVGMADWYAKHLGLRVVKEGPPPINGRFLAEQTGRVMLEIYSNPKVTPPDYAAMDPLILHVAFPTDDVKGTRERLISAGATAMDEVTISDEGDELAMLRDPRGLAIQLVKRATPMV